MSGNSAGAQPGVTRVGLLGRDLVNWTGGSDFLRLCAGALSPRYTRHVETVLLFPKETSIQRLRRLASPWKQVALQLVHGESPRWNVRGGVNVASVVESVSSFGGRIQTQVFTDDNKTLGRAVAKTRCDVVLPFTVAPQSVPVPWVGYIPDLQHIHLPQFFCAEEREARDRRFRQMLSSARAIIVNAREVKHDLERVYGPFACKVFDLPFAPVPNPEWFSLDIQAVKAKHGVARPYFIVCNQFWIHKSHETVFSAMRLLYDCGLNGFDLVCTGMPDDYRAPHHFDNLRAQVARARLTKQVRFLGFVPKSEQIALMRGAIALVQPTLFEGGPGGGSVYDAACVGTPAIVSDIAVNRELSGIDVMFFQAACAEDLAGRMREVMTNSAIRPSPEQLLHDADARVEKLSARLMEAILFARYGHSRVQHA